MTASLEIGRSFLQGKTPIISQGVGKNQIPESSHPAPSTHGGSFGSRPSSNYSSRSQQVIAPQKGIKFKCSMFEYILFLYSVLFFGINFVTFSITIIGGLLLLFLGLPKVRNQVLYSEGNYFVLILPKVGSVTLY